MYFQKAIRLLLLIIAAKSFGQSEIDVQVLNAVIDYERDKGISDIKLNCSRSGTFFDMETFRLESEVKIPQEVLYTLAIHVLKSTSGSWDATHSKTSVPKSQKETDIVCISDQKIRKLFNKSGKRQNILSVSTPVYDLNSEYCLVQVSYWKFTKSSYGMSCILHKKASSWEVLTEFAFWMS